MLKKSVFLALVGMLLLGACSQATPPAPTATPTSAPTAVPTAAPTSAAQSAAGASCTISDLLPPLAKNYVPVTDSDWSLGAKDANLTFTVYSDYECPYCSQLDPVLMQLRDTNPDTVRIVFRHFPLTIHSKSLIAAQAAEAAGLQGKFWEMNERIFARQAEWSDPAKTADVEQWLVDQAADLKLDAEKFKADMKSDAIVKKIADAQTAGINTLGLDHTPYVFVNGRYFDGLPLDLETLKMVVKVVPEMEKFTTRQFKACPPMAIDVNKKYTATLKTEKGDIVLDLFADKAPITVNVFVFLARQGWFDNITFHRVLATFVAQTGDPTGQGWGGPGFEYINEINTDLKFDKAGMVGMANSGKDTNGSQFFITLGDTSQLNDQYTVFGQVSQGMDVVEKLTARDPSQSDTLPPGDKLISVTITEQ